MAQYQLRDFKQAHNGDEQAFNRIFTCHEGVVWSVYKRLNHCLPADQWQQECRIILLKCIRTISIQQAQQLSGYFKRACLNYVANYFQRQLPRQNEYQQELQDDFRGLAEPVNCVAWHMADKKMMVKEVLAEFSTRERQIVILILAGYKQIEVAQKLAISKSLVSFEWRRLRRMLQDEL